MILIISALLKYCLSLTRDGDSYIYEMLLKMSFIVCEHMSRRVCVCGLHTCAINRNFIISCASKKVCKKFCRIFCKFFLLNSIASKYSSLTHFILIQDTFYNKKH